MLGVQGQAGQPQQVGQHGVPSQISGGDLNAQGVMPPTVPHVDGGSSAVPPHHPFPTLQPHRQQAQISLNVPPRRTSLQSPDMLSGMGPSISQPFLSQASPDGSQQLSVQGGQAQDGAALAFDADAEGRKRKGAPEGDVKRVRQRTGKCISYPKMAETNNRFPKSTLQIQLWLVVLTVVDIRCANSENPLLVQRRSHFCPSNWGSCRGWSSIGDSRCLSATRSVPASKDRVPSCPPGGGHGRRPRPACDRRWASPFDGAARVARHQRVGQH